MDQLGERVSYEKTILVSLPVAAILAADVPIAQAVFVSTPPRIHYQSGWSGDRLVEDWFGRTATGGGAADAEGEEGTCGCQEGGEARRVLVRCGFRQGGARGVAATVSSRADGADESGSRAGWGIAFR
jgi:hypothetical protein